MKEYKVLRTLGKGGNSIAYMAQDKDTNELVTIKKCRETENGCDIHVKKNLENEARILNNLYHPAIPKLHEYCEGEIVLDYIAGNSFDKVLYTKGTLKEKEAVEIAKEIANILRYLHGRREPVIYRDLKPSNIILKPDGHVALIDFGAARKYKFSDRADTVNLGTPGFAAPEQFGNLGQTDPRTDIYCLGMTLLQMISGVDTADTDEVMEYKRRGVKGISPELMRIIEKCTRPDRDDRFKSAKEIQAALESYPRKVKKRKIKENLKRAFMVMAASLVITIIATKGQKAVAYAAEDFRGRGPAVAQRFAYLRTWLDDLIDKKQEEKDGKFSLYFYDSPDSIDSSVGNNRSADRQRS